MEDTNILTNKTIIEKHKLTDVTTRKIILEGYAQVNETANISGVALIPRISRNNNLYTKAELERFNGVTVPLNWEHNPENVIGTATFHYNPALETVYYEGTITDEGAASLAKNKTLFTSIEANPQDMKEVCNGIDDCFSMPFGLTPVGLALTETPGVPETSVKVIESYLEECKACEDTQAKTEEIVKDIEGVTTTDFTKFKEQIYNHLNVEVCEDCGDLHTKKN